LQRVLFGDRHETRRAIDLAGGGVDHALHAQLARRLHDIECALDVGIDVGVGRVVRIGDRDQRRQVHHHVAAMHRGAHAMRVADVAGKNIERLLDRGLCFVEPAPGVEAVVEHEGAHFVAAANEAFCQVRADEAVGAGDEDALAL
jgi:hypothetical protein